MRYDFEVRAGNSGTVANEVGLELTLKDEVDGALIPKDLAGADVVFVVRRMAGQPPILRRDASDGVIVDPSAGHVLIPLSVQDTRAMGAAAINGAVAYEVEHRPAAGGQRTELFGVITVLPGVNDD